MDEQGDEPADELALEPVAVVRKARPRALWAVLAAVGVAAGAVVVTSTDDDGNQRAGLPVDLAETARIVNEAAADSSMLARVTYVPGDELPTLGGEATAYRLAGEVDEDQVRQLADALGLDGAVEQGPDGTFSVTGGDDDGQLEVYTGGGAYWSYSSPSCVQVAEDLVTCSGGGAASSGGSTGTAACDGDLPTSPECTVTTIVDGQPCGAGKDCVEAPTTTLAAGTAERLPDLPLDLPPEEEARQVALDVVAASGVDVDGARVTVDQGYNWVVTVELVLDGIPSGRFAYVEVGSGAAVISGNGSMGRPEAHGDCPLVDTRGAIDRANEQGGAYRYLGTEPALGGSGATGGGGGTDPDAPDTTVVGSTDPGVDPIEPITPFPCKVQPDGSEICEMEECASDGTTPGDDIVATTVCERTVCSAFAAEPGTASSAAEDEVECPQPDPGVDPIPDLQPIEIVLVAAEPSLVIMVGNDGTGDVYLVPAYRFTAEDGGTVDLAAIAEEALTAPNTTDTVPATAPPEPVPVPEPQPCEILEEGDSTGTSHTVQSCPTPNEDPGTLKPGEEPVIGVAYYVDIDFACPGFLLGDQVWVPDDRGVAAWERPGEPYEGGMFTLDAEGHGTFVGDEARTKVADFHLLGPAEDLFCTPGPR